MGGILHSALIELLGCTKKLKILVVDDNPLARRLAAAIIEREGHEVVAVDAWHQVNQLIFKEGVDLAFVDVNMPGLSGDKLIEILKRSRSGKQLPLVLLSDLPAEDLAKRAVKAGADGFLNKPLTTAAVKEVIREHCLGSEEID